MNFSLSPEQKLLTETAAACGAKIPAGDFMQRWKFISEHGLSLMLADEKEKSFSVIHAALVLKSLAASGADGGMIFSLAAHLCAGLFPVLNYGSAGQREKIITAIRSGNGVMANAMTETFSGSDAFSMQTSAVKTDNGYRISGSKVFVTNAPVADFIVLYARTDSSKGFFGGITAFLIEKGKHGYLLGETVQKLGLDHSPLCEIFLDDVEVNDDAVIGKAGSGAMIFQHSMNAERAVMSAMHAGTMHYLVQLVTNYVKQREAAGKSLSSHQAVAFRIADMQVRMETSQLLALKAAAIMDNGKDATLVAAQAKIFSSEALVLSAQDALVLHGGNGFAAASKVSEILRDAQASLLYSGANDVLRQIVSTLA